jgi:hypothetical protein
VFSGFTHRVVVKPLRGPADDTLMGRNLKSNRDAWFATLTGLGVGLWMPLRLLYASSWTEDAVFEGAFAGLIAFWGMGSLSIPVLVIAMVPWVSWMGAVFGSAAPWVAVGALAKLPLVTSVLSVRVVFERSERLHPAFARLVPILLIVPLVANAVACGWIALGSGTAGPLPEDRTLEYIKAMYWAITTLATVGYGDISAKTGPQMLYAASTMIVGVGFFGYVLSNVASILARLDSAREQHLTELDHAEAFMRSRRLPAPLRAEIRGFFKYLWETRHGGDDRWAVEKLPEGILAKVLLHENASMLAKVPLLKGVRPALLRELVLRFEQRVGAPSELLFEAGDPGDEMFFILAGEVEILGPEGNILVTLTGGSFFGETALLTSAPRSASARCKGFVDLCVLSKVEFEAVAARHPEFQKNIHEHSRARQKAA